MIETEKYGAMDIWCMVSDYNKVHGTRYWNFEELSGDTGTSIEDFIWEME